jgi:drug/metabolite transporter (DMT)-like permease
MTPVVGGTLSALGLGTGDFMARFSSRAFGHAEALFGVLLVGSLLLTAWGLVSGSELVWTWRGAHLLALNGIATTTMTLLLYKGLARGPVSVVAAIVAAHPVLVVLIAVVIGARPSLVQWLAMATTIAGTVLVAAAAREGEGESEHAPGGIRVTIIISLTACLFYAILVSAGQHAVPIYGEFQTLWFSRVISLAALLIWFAGRRTAPRIPRRWWPFVAAQAMLDTGGYFALFAGSAGPNAEIAAVIAATFGGVTILLAWIVLRERIVFMQWVGIAMILAGVVTLS